MEQRENSGLEVLKSLVSLEVYVHPYLWLAGTDYAESIASTIERRIGGDGRGPREA